MKLAAILTGVVVLGMVWAGCAESDDAGPREKTPASPTPESSAEGETPADLAAALVIARDRSKSIEVRTLALRDYIFRVNKAKDRSSALREITKIDLERGGTAPRPAPPSRPWELMVAPAEDTNPKNTKHTFIATVWDQEGRPLPDVKVHWILAHLGDDRVGEIAEYDIMDPATVVPPRGPARPTHKHHVVTYTLSRPVVLAAEMRWKPNPADRKNFQVLPGQTWCTITSATDGDSLLIAYVPGIEGDERHFVTALKHWSPGPK